MNEFFLGAAKQAPGSSGKDYNCLSCKTAITNPLCPDCISNWFFSWMRNYPRLGKMFYEEINGFLRLHRRLGRTGPRCASCRRKSSPVCPTCFTNYLYSLLKKAKAKKKEMLEFLFMFNFDFERDVYAKDMEALGGY